MMEASALVETNPFPSEEGFIMQLCLSAYKIRNIAAVVCHFEMFRTIYALSL